MAKARMLHWKISTSLQVNRLSLEARLLFTWMIAHADDEGRIRGEFDYIKGKVFPMTEYKHSDIEKFLDEITTQKLIIRWERNGEWYIEFPSWLDHQQIRKNRFRKSQIPAYEDRQSTANVPPKDNQWSPQSNLIKSNKIQNNESELEISSRKKEHKELDPNTFEPTDNDTFAAFEVFKRLEPNNHKSLQTTYLAAIKKGVPAHILFQFASEIEQDKTVRVPGAIFNTKIIDFLKKNSQK